MSSSASSRLAEYLEKRGISAAEFAKVVGANRSQIYRLVTGERGPSVGLAARIEHETAGAVRATDWAAPERRRPRSSQH